MPPKGRRAPIAVEEDSSDGENDSPQRPVKPVQKKSQKNAS